MANCPHCGSYESGLFCTKCGASMAGAVPSTDEPSASPITNDVATCPQCGSLEAGLFCTKCGARNVGVALPPGGASSPVGAGPTCPRCGSPESGQFCTKCGASMAVAAPPGPRPVAPSGLMQSSAAGFYAPNLRGGGFEPPPQMVVVAPTPALPPGPFRRTIVWETRFVMLAFLLPTVVSALIVLSQHVNGVQNITNFPTIVHHQPVTNLILLIVAYLPVASTVPIALLLLSRTGQSPKVLGIGVPSFTRDVIPGLGIGALALACEFVILIPFAQLLTDHPGLITKVSEGAVPKYYIIYGVILSATTAVAEEVMVNGYLMTRLHQLGWSDKKSLALSLTLRTSYHIYYGFGFLLTVPFGYFNTRSFQKHHKLNRPIVAHFLFDAILITISILVR